MAEAGARSRRHRRGGRPRKACFSFVQELESSRRAPYHPLHDGHQILVPWLRQGHEVAVTVEEEDPVRHALVLCRSARALAVRRTTRSMMATRSSSHG